MTRDGWHVRPFRPGDAPRILALHRRMFAGHEPRSEAHWHWKFEANSLRRTEVMVAEQGGECVGVYAGIPHRAILEGEPCLAGLHVDVAVDTNRRRGLSGARLLVRLMREYFARYAGGDVRLTWGYPEPPLQRIGLRFVRFHVLRDVGFLVRAAGHGTDLADAIQVRVVRRFDATVDALWERCRSEVRTGTVRDEAYLNWRYARHPDVQHVLLEARDGDGGALRGIAVAREGGWHPDLLSIMDWLTPLADVEAERALLAALETEAVARGRSWLCAWVAGQPERFRRFQVEYGFHVHPTPYQECFRSWDARATRRHLNDSWYQTMGDIDFF